MNAVYLTVLFTIYSICTPIHNIIIDLIIIVLGFFVCNSLPKQFDLDIVESIGI